jgi:ferredoxin
MMTVACSSRETGKTTRSMCKVGCIACKMCVKQTELFTMDGNIANLDYEKYEPDEQTETAMTKCPTGVIVYRGKNAPPPRPAGQKKAAAKA